MTATTSRSALGSRSIIFYFILSLLAVGLYLFVAFLQNGEFGFPLDDAWIHQVYARNLGTRLEFSFFAGQPSTGSTSPLWAVWLSVGYLLRIDYPVWTIGLGIVCLAASGWMASRVTRHLTQDSRVVIWFAPLLVMLEWHMVWAAASGMEILLFVALALALVEAFFAQRNALLSGVVAGLLTLTRPEGTVLVGLVGAGMGLDALREPKRFLRVGQMAMTFLVVLAPYLLFNLQTSGTLLPNTFYAKGAEYAELTARTNFFARWLSMYRQPLIGAQLLLAPGLVYGLVVLARQKDWTRLLPAMWIVILPALYAWRLPVEYQFGRYMMPIIPFVLIYGVVGTASLFLRMGGRKGEDVLTAGSAGGGRGKGAMTVGSGAGGREKGAMTAPLRLLRRAWGMTTAVLLVAFLALGANFYAQSVAIVNCEMVATARWARANVPQGALVAVHDIGAQGYFDEHPMLDLAGLVSPEVIPFIRDEPRLKAWMKERGAQYAIFFPTWYPNLSNDAEFQEVFATGCAVTRTTGEENLKVYSLK